MKCFYMPLYGNEYLVFIRVTNFFFNNKFNSRNEEASVELRVN